MFLTSCLLVASALAGNVLPFEIQARTLDNGLRVVAVATPAEGVAAVRTWFAVGSRDETRDGETGYAHFFEHLMFHGTATRPRGTRDAQIVRMGAEDNAWTWFDETVYSTTLPAEDLDAFFATEADRFAHLALTPEGVRREAGAVYGEFRKSQASPDERLSDTLYATAFSAHTYHHSTIGYERDIAAMPEGYEACLRFFHTFYRPQRATVLVVGGIEPEVVFEQVERHFGGWAGADISEPPPPIEPEPPQVGTRRAHVAWPTPTAPRLAMGWKVPGHDPASEDLARLELLASYLNARTGPLHRVLVEEKQLALSVRVGRDDFVDPGLFRIAVQLTPGASLDEAESAVREVLGSITPADLTDVQRHTRLADLLDLESPDALVSALGWQLRRGESADALDVWYDTRATADLAGLPQVIAATFVDEALTVVTLTAASEEAP